MQTTSRAVKGGVFDDLTGGRVLTTLNELEAFMFYLSPNDRGGLLVLT